VGVQTKWRLLDRSTPLLPEVVSEIDANSVFTGGGRGRSGLELDSAVASVCKFQSGRLRFAYK